MIQKLMMRLYLYLERKLNIPTPIPDNMVIIEPKIYEILPDIKLWVTEQESTDTSGEFKRHQVYAKAIKEYPDMRKRDLALAIEIAIQTAI